VEHVAQTLNLSQVDAATYVRLCMGGPWKVSELATAMDVHRNDVYRSLERLGARGLVETTLENPARYTAADPVKMLGMELDARAGALESLRQARERTMGLVSSLRAAAQNPPKTTYRIVQGRQEVAAMRRRMIAGATQEVMGLTTSPHSLAVAEFDGTLDAMLAQRDAGVRLRLLMDVPDEELRRVGLAPPRGSLEVRRLETPAPIQFLIVDGREILMSVVEDPARSLYAPGDVALVSAAPGLLEAERVFFDLCWEQAVRPAGAGAPL
jgi:sugar-specific transcriptional regulator TrmB